MTQITITIDGRKVAAEAGETILEASLRQGIYIPNLCHHPDLKPMGACRLCLVEIEGRKSLVASCSTEAEDGMVIRTKTERAERLRRLSMELILTEHPEDCSTCWRYGSCPMQSLLQFLSMSTGRMRNHHLNYKKDTGNPLFIRDMSRCIKCGRCVRMCKEIRGSKALDFIKCDNGELEVKNVWSQTELDQCKYCTACVEVCPTGALRDKEETFKFPEQYKQKKYASCRWGCPAQTDVPRYVRYVKEGKYEEALRVIREKLPIPRILGYLCEHPCEDSCRRGSISQGDQIAIRELKRLAVEESGDSWKADSKIRKETGLRVAVVGAGPGGLTAAYYLRHQGHQVTIFEMLPEAGGMVRYGVPEYRIPREVVRKEVEDIQSFEIDIKTNTKISSIQELKNQGYDAVLLAVGTHQGVKLPLKGSELQGVLVNLEFLKADRLDHAIIPGKKVVVLGGGNVAFDCAGLALRLGAETVSIACLESRDEMTASKEEIENGEAEGVVLLPSSSFKEIIGENGAVTGMRLAEVESFCFDEERKATIKIKADSEFTIPCDTVIFGVGQKPEGMEAFGLDLVRGGYLKTDSDHACSEEGVFAVGDAVTGTRTIIQAVAEARRAVASIDRYLGGDGDIDETLIPMEKPNGSIGEEPGFGLLKREKTIEPFTESQAGCEASRCLQCDLRELIGHVPLYSDYDMEGGEKA
ncbi:2Fe-2S iron-sulfur cluster binding domain-containing protein [Anoxybacterium hadale]|uniref:2Fe-2S iron-sulfur cluster binding domain-containing protein n=1 Tax=Anoxybacterium hadale TaxID=3408580 RepID=A0ACD1A6B3_9FIRM|nr:2Fe-2S iron-sulfur cluster binding domain-containing protein [Clostridiales bacterium]